MKVLNIAIMATAASVGNFANGFTPLTKSVTRSTNMQRNLFGKLFSVNTSEYPIMAEEAVMSQKAHGTSEKPVQKDLRWKCDFDTAVSLKREEEEIVRVCGSFLFCLSFNPSFVLSTVSSTSPLCLICAMSSQFMYLICTHLQDRICNFNRHYAEYAGYWRFKRVSA